VYVVSGHIRAIFKVQAVLELLGPGKGNITFATFQKSEHLRIQLPVFIITLSIRVYRTLAYSLRGRGWVGRA
jgi:hypothetical protein